MNSKKTRGVKNEEKKNYSFSNKFSRAFKLVLDYISGTNFNTKKTRNSF